jgi:peptide/nickel transport system ATP-binding protein
MALLEVENLSIGYETRTGFSLAVEGVSFSLDRGKSTGFIGESGCGKTTIGMSLMRLLPDNASIIQGRILFDGENLLELSDAEMRKVRWKKIAMIFQAAMNALNPVHRVDEQIAEAILTHERGLERTVVMARVRELFDLVEIPTNRMRDYPHQFSGGMKQRAVIAMALACRPPLIIADEPTTALDVIVQDQILKAIKEIQKKLNIAVVFISHDIAVVAEVCDDLGIMYAGQLIEYGCKDEVFRAPLHPYTKALLSSYFALEGDREALLASPESRSFQINKSPLGCRYCTHCDKADGACRNQPVEWVEINADHHVLCPRCK